MSILDLFPAPDCVVRKLYSNFRACIVYKYISYILSSTKLGGGIFVVLKYSVETHVD